MDNNLTIVQNVDVLRDKAGYWIIHEESDNEESIELLTGVYTNISDYMGKRPYLVFDIDKPRPLGEIFENVFMLYPNQIDMDTSIFLVNELFMEKCLPRERLIKTESENSDEKKSIPFWNVLDAFTYLFDPKYIVENLQKLYDNEVCLFIGVYGDSPIHSNRGIDNGEQKTEQSTQTA